MAVSSDRFVEDLRTLVADLESLVARAKSADSERGEDEPQAAGADSASLIDHALSRVNRFQADLRRHLTERAKAADDTVRENAWTTIAVGAATAFVLGFTLAHRRSAADRPRACHRLRRSDVGAGSKGAESP